MRGRSDRQSDLITLLNVEDRIPAKHPIRRIKRMVDVVLRRLDGEFATMYAPMGPASMDAPRVPRAIASPNASVNAAKTSSAG